MQTVLITLTMAALMFLLTACSAQRPLITAPQPASAPFLAELPRKLSTVNISFSATAAETANFLNQAIPKELYKGPLKNSSVNAKITRNGAIGVSMVDSSIQLTIPVTIFLSYSFFSLPETPFKLKVALLPGITPDWRITTEITSIGVAELFADELRIGSFSINPRSAVEGVTQPLQKSLSGIISARVNEKYPLKPKIAAAWQATGKPLLLDRNYGAWLSLSPVEITATPLYAWENRARISLGIAAYADLTVGPQPAAPAIPPLPRLKQAGRIDKNFRISLKTELFYRDLLAAISPLILNKDFGSDGKSVILKDFDLYGNGDRLIMRVRTDGSLAGTFYMTCRPAFDPVTGLFSVEDVDFDMNSESLLLTSADWFLHGTIRERIREKINLNLSNKLAESRGMAQKALKEVKLAEHVVLRGDLGELRLSDILVQQDRVFIRMEAEGEAELKITP